MRSLFPKEGDERADPSPCSSSVVAFSKMESGLRQRTLMSYLSVFLCESGKVVSEIRYYFGECLVKSKRLEISYGKRK